MICNMCNKPIVDDQFKKTWKHYYHLGDCWKKVKKYWFIALPSILGVELLIGLTILLVGIFTGFWFRS